LAAFIYARYTCIAFVDCKLWSQHEKRVALIQEYLIRIINWLYYTVYIVTVEI